jgi:hypothetical protein
MSSPSVPNRVWIEIGVFAAVSLGLYLLTPGVFLFLIPLQMLAIRRGSSAFNLAALLLVMLAGLVELAMAGWRSDLPAEEDYLRNIGLFLSALLLGGLWLINQPRVLPYRSLLRILIATGAAGLVAVPFVGGLVSDPEFIPTMRQYIAGQPLLRLGIAPPDPTGVAGAPAVSAEQIDLFIDTIGTVLLRGVLFLYLVYLMAAWWLGSLWGARTIGLRSPIGRLLTFRLEPWCIWALLLSGAAVLGDSLGDLGILGYVGWNLFSVFLLLFALQGIGVLQWLFRRYNVPGPMRIMIAVAMVFMLFRSVLTFIPVFGLPLLGLSETWFDFKRPRPGEQNKDVT